MAKQDPEWNPNFVGDYDRIAELHSEAVTPMFPEMAGVLAPNRRIFGGVSQGTGTSFMLTRGSGNRSPWMPRFEPQALANYATERRLQCRGNSNAKPL
jgi:hypothetical protein